MKFIASSLLFYVIYISTVSAVCNLRDRECRTDADCQYDTLGHNHCVLPPYGGYGSCQRGESPCPMKDQSYITNSNCKLNANGLFVCDARGPIWYNVGVLYNYICKLNTNGTYDCDTRAHPGSIHYH